MSNDMSKEMCLKIAGAMIRELYGLALNWAEPEDILDHVLNVVEKYKGTPSSTQFVDDLLKNLDGDEELMLQPGPGFRAMMERRANTGPAPVPGSN